MDAHFSEYLVTIPAMLEIYGELADEFHKEAERHNEAEVCQGCLSV